MFRDIVLITFFSLVAIEIKLLHKDLKFKDLAHTVFYVSFHRGEKVI